MDEIDEILDTMDLLSKYGVDQWGTITFGIKLLVELKPSLEKELSIIVLIEQLKQTDHYKKVNTELQEHIDDLCERMISPEKNFDDLFGEDIF